MTADARRSPESRVTLERDTVAWIRRRIGALAAGMEFPRFGSVEWHQLDEHNPLREASVILAAACWWDESRPARIAQQLEDEIRASRQVSAAADAEQFARAAADVRRRAHSPTWAEIERRWVS